MKQTDLMCYPFLQTDLVEHNLEAKLNPKMDATVFHCTCIPPFMTQNREMLTQIAWFRALLSQNDVAIAGNTLDLKDAPKDHRVAVLGLHNPPVDSPYLNALRCAGVRIMNLAFETDTIYGGGFANPEAPLTVAGKDLLHEMMNNGMILDLSHVGHRTARDTLEFINVYGGPTVCATHTGVFEVYNHPRNLPLDVLKEIISLGGIVGILTLGFMLDGTDNSVGPFLRHLQYALKHLGEDGVAVGTDDVYQVRNSEEDRQLFNMMKSRLDPRGNFRARYPDRPPEMNRPDKMDALAKCMLAQRIPPETITRVIETNALRFLRENLA